MNILLKRLGEFLLDIIEAVVTALAIFVIIWLFFFQAHQVKGSSMHSTLEDGDYLLTDKFSYRIREPERGDIIVFHAPGGRDDYIKRIIGLPGEQIEIKNNTVYIDGAVLKEEYLDEKIITRGGGSLREGTANTIGEGEYYAFGDNRIASSDSRDFGPIKKENIVGKAWIRYWPPPKLGLIKKEEYY